MCIQIYINYISPENTLENYLIFNDYSGIQSDIILMMMTRELHFKYRINLYYIKFSALHSSSL